MGIAQEKSCINIISVFIGSREKFDPLYILPEKLRKCQQRILCKCMNAAARRHANLMIHTVPEHLREARVDSDDIANQTGLCMRDQPLKGRTICRLEPMKENDILFPCQRIKFVHHIRRKSKGKFAKDMFSGV